ncbi:MAG: SLBB domain-containing protein [Proteobacteria bacterium]|nr:SLBB domain-containing protein [Pseudomonadota bacterium]
MTRNFLVLVCAIGRVLPAIVVSALTVVALITPSPRVLAQSAGTSDLLQTYQNLTPDQQQAILKQLGGGAGGLSSILGGQSGVASGSVPDRQGALNRLREAAEASRSLTESEESEVGALKGDDWVVVEVALFGSPGLGVLQGSPASTSGTGSPQVTAASPPQAVIPPEALPAGAALLGANSRITGSRPQFGELAAAIGVPPAEALPQNASADESRRAGVVALIRSRNPYQLSHSGELTLPGFAPMPLLGLDEEQATLRLAVEPGLQGLNVRLIRLPLHKAGAAGLEPFGYGIFSRSAPTTFAPVANVPVPSGYVVGPGDELSVDLYGSQNRSLRLVVSRDGHVNLPDIGPVNVAGQTFTAVKAGIEARVERQMIGVHASVSMGDTRSLHVFVLGEVRQPGTYTLSAFATITSALYAAGGIKRVGSLRQVQVKRHGALVRTLDLYDLLIRGDTANDAKLLDGDAILVPSVGPTAGISGEVRRPALYELRGESTVAGLVQLAGGLTPEADASKAMLTGFDDDHRRVVRGVGLSADAPAQRVRNGDLLSVARMHPTLDSGVMVQGYVFAPGAFAWHPGVRLSGVIRSVDDLRPNADLHYLLIRREAPTDRHVNVLSADLTAALAAPGSAADPELQPRDRITVFDLATSRDQVIQPLLDELRLQGHADRPAQIAQVQGRIRVPGTYPLELGMTVRDLVRAGGGTADEAYGASAELVRYRVTADGARQTELFNVDLNAALRGDPAANMRLQPFDTLTVKETPEWGRQESVYLNGEVRFPGSYTIRPGESLKSVLARAGGLTRFAFPEGSVFTRDELRVREQEQLDMLAERMQRDIALLALQAAGAGQSGAAGALSVGQSLLSQLKASKAVGRLVIDLPRLEASRIGSPYDVILHGGDTISVPRYQQQITVIGEVQNVTSHLFSPGLTRDDYISKSGGFTHRADRGRIYVVRANGSVVAAEGSRWFQRGGNVPIRPGDTIVVPLDTEHYPALPFWQAVTQILYNVAIATATIRTIK